MLPAILTDDVITLGAECSDGTLIRGQNNISHPPTGGSRDAGGRGGLAGLCRCIAFVLLWEYGPSLSYTVYLQRIANKLPLQLHDRVCITESCARACMCGGIYPGA